MEAVIAGVHRFFNKPDNPQQRGSPDYAVHVSRFPRDAIGAIRRFASAVPSGVPLRVYAMGGDGLLFDCLNGIIGLPNVELGIMPYGSQNDFYRVFGKKNRSLFNSLEAQTRAPSVPVDAACCGSNYVLSHCMIGMEPIFAASIRRVQKYPFLKRLFSSRLAVNYLSLLAAMNSRVAKQNYRLCIDGEDLSGMYFLIPIMNTSWYGGHQYYSDVDPTDGYLDVMASSSISLLDLFRRVKAQKGFGLGDVKAANYYKKNQDFITYRRAKKISVASESALVLNLDGEFFYDKCITVEVKPGAVRIINPNLAGGS